MPRKKRDKDGEAEGVDEHARRRACACRSARDGGGMMELVVLRGWQRRGEGEGTLEGLRDKDREPYRG